MGTEAGSRRLVLSVVARWGGRVMYRFTRKWVGPLALVIVGG
jgi:hypothetical protein